MLLVFLFFNFRKDFLQPAGAVNLDESRRPVDGEQHVGTCNKMMWYTPGNLQWNPKNGGLVQMIFLFKQVICLR